MSHNQAFSQKNIAFSYAAFGLRDPYYVTMSRLVADAALKAYEEKEIKAALDLGAGIGISTLEVARKTKAKKMYAIEPSADMRGMLERVVSPYKHIKVLDGSAETVESTLKKDAEFPGALDVITCCHMFHLLHPSKEESHWPEVCKQFYNLLNENGMVAFDFGPSHYSFNTLLADHTTGEIPEDAVMTELAHPLFQKGEKILREKVKKIMLVEKTLWPARHAMIDFDMVKKYFLDAGFSDVKAEEIMVPLSGESVLNIFDNSWAVFFRWAPPEFTMDERRKLVDETISELWQDPEIEKMLAIEAKHPSAVFTAKK